MFIYFFPIFGKFIFNKLNVYIKAIWEMRVFKNAKTSLSIIIVWVLNGYKIVFLWITVEKRSLESKQQSALVESKFKPEMQASKKIFLLTPPKKVIKRMESILAKSKSNCEKLKGGWWLRPCIFRKRNYFEYWALPSASWAA